MKTNYSTQGIQQLTAVSPMGLCTMELPFLLILVFFLVNIFIP